jgi:hypothetical protein
MFRYLFDEIIAEFGDVDALVGCVSYMGGPVTGVVDLLLSLIAMPFFC